MQIIEQLNSQQVTPTEGLTVTIERLADLLFAEQEEGFPLPTQHAYQKTTYLLNTAHNYLQGSFPRANVSVEEHGGVFVYWIKPSCTVQLTIPSSPEKLFSIRVRKNGSTSRAYQDVTGKRLAECLQAFNLMN